MAELTKLVANRKANRSRVTRSFNERESFKGFTPVQREVEKSNLLDYQESLKLLDSRIQDLKLTSSEPCTASDIERDAELCLEYEEKIRTCLAILQSLEISVSSPTDALTVGQIDAARSLLKQPTAPLPTFEGREDEDLMKFLSEFELTTSNYRYPDRDLLLLLTQQVSGSAKTLIKSLEADKQTYCSAKELLIAAFASEKKRKSSSISKLIELMLGYNDDPYEYISKVKMLHESIKSLSITAEDFVQFFVWRGLNKKFQMHLTQITSENIPSLQQILDKFFEAVERYRVSQKSESQNKSSSKNAKHHSSSGFAVNIKEQNLGTKCNLCGEVGTHTFHHCTQFPTAKEKVDKLNALGGCTKCGNMNHTIGDCSFKLKFRCYHCKKWHFKSLCTGRETESDSKVKNSKKSVTVESNTRVVSLPYYKSGSILPTFVSKVKGKLCRGLIDRASEGSFVTEKLASSLGLKVIHYNVNLTVNGFNGPQNYVSKVVETPIEIAGSDNHILALVIPDVHMCLKLPNMSLVTDSFKQKGYKLADSFLRHKTNKIDKIDFVLGADYSRLIIGKDVPFGRDSIYIESSVGTLLIGNLQKLKADLSSLPNVNSVTSNLARIDGSPSMGERCTYSVNLHTFFVSKLTSVNLHEDVDRLEYSNLIDESEFSVLDSLGRIQHDKVQKATDQILELQCRQYISQDGDVYNDTSCELNKNLIDYTIKNIIRTDEGRIKVPLLWNGKVKNCLADNCNLAKVILKTSLKKLQKGYKLQKDGGQKLDLIDQTFREQEESGIIERIDNLEEYLNEHPGSSFLPHMPIFKFGRDTTKCRVVFLSNLSEKRGSKYLSHNQAMLAGPTLNHKLSSALLQLRFGRFLLIYDLKKAFNQLELSDIDQSKLLFFWFKNVRKNDFSLVAFKNVRLSFGLRCSPFLLLISLFYILVIEADKDVPELQSLKHLMYSLLYMDNGAISSDSVDHLHWAYSQLPSIFSPYCFDVQQISTNELTLQREISADLKESSIESVKLLGLLWNKKDDILCTRPIDLDKSANTKRKVLASIASQFDIDGFNMPILNRSRIFMHSLQCDRTIGWDDVLSTELQRNWKNICAQANSCPPIEIPRLIGPRDGTYKLLVFTDTSHDLYGSVLYLYHNESQRLSFVCAKNHIVNNKLKGKSIPSLELNALVLGVNNLMDVYKDLTGPSCLNPISITELFAFTDSVCCIHWLRSAVIKLDKLAKLSVFVKNRLKTLQDLCEQVPVTFKFIAGEVNPADCVTRSLSHKQLVKSNFLVGPSNNVMKLGNNVLDEFTVIVPNPAWTRNPTDETVHSEKLETFNFFSVTNTYPSLLNPVNYSSFLHMMNLYRRILLCVKTWKSNTFKGKPDNNIENNLYGKVLKIMFRADQLKFFPDVVQYFLEVNNLHKDSPELVNRLNVIMDGDGILRVKSKFKSWHYNPNKSFPILLHNNSDLARIIILDSHRKLAHSGCYAVLAELRKNFFILKHFSTIKKCLKECTHCSRFNSRTIKLNQSQYREFRSDPPQTPFANVFVDHLGPFTVKKHNTNCKVWLLCITCLWTRAVNLKICHDLSVREFLRTFQLHCFEYGIPQLFMSDLGSQLVSGVNTLKDFLNDPDVLKYFEFNKVKPLTFQQYFKGCHELGSLVETCVKMVKRLIFGSIRNNILDIIEFEYIISYVVHLVNKRPIAFKDESRCSENIPEPITPELLIRGYELTSLNIIPDLLDIPEDSPWSSKSELNSSIKDSYHKLRKVNSEVKKLYTQEFLGNLISQAVDQKDRYKPVTHKGVKIGDVVLIKEENMKPNHYPLAIINSVITNDLGEITGAIVKKGRTNELVKRHSSTLIPLLESNTKHVENDNSKFPNENKNQRPTRKAALKSRDLTLAMLNDGLL